MLNKRLYESGQVIVILALVFTGLLAFAALAIDGGMVYSDRRFAQNAADSSALAGAGAAAMAMDKNGIYYQNLTCTGAHVAPAVVETAAENAAILRASNNQFIIDSDLSDNLGVEVLCNIVTVGSFADKYIDVHVVVTSTTRTAFAQLFVPGGLVNTVETVARAYPRTPFVYGVALAGLCSSGDCLEFNGTSDVVVSGGGIWSNAGLDKNGASGTVTVNGGYGVFSRQAPSGHIEKITPAPTWNSSVPPLPKPPVPAPDCASLPDRGSSNGGALLPGRYSGIDVKNNTTLAPGLYCLSGDIKDTNKDLTGDGVTIYMASGEIRITGGVINLKAPTTEPTGAGAPIKGMLVYAAFGNTNDFLMEGNATSYYQGSLYVPDGSIDIGGTADIPYATQVVANIVKTHGNATINVNYNQNYDFSEKPKIELNK